MRAHLFGKDEEASGVELEEARSSEASSDGDVVVGNVEVEGEGSQVQGGAVGRSCSGRV